MQKESVIERSSASIIAGHLYEQRGIFRADICSDDLGEIYRDLTAVFPPASLSLAAEMLSSVAPAAGNSLEEFYGVIVETRKHPALEAVICNVLNVCQIPVQLFHGATNRDFIMSTRIAEKVESGQLILSELNVEHLAARDYNGLLMLPRFWECIPGRRKILVFQTDSICCSQSDYSLKNFSTFDYIGCNWSRYRPIGLTIDGGNGGFSLRDWSVSIQCLAKFDPGLWHGGEDGYYAFHMELMGARVADYIDSSRFGTQTEFLDRSFGGHQVGILKPLELEAFIKYCPEAKVILSGKPQLD